MNTSVRRRLGVLVAAAVSVSLLAGCASGGSAGDKASVSSSSAAHPTAAAGSTVPDVTVKAGFSPYGDELMGIAGVTRGYFKDVGITFDPAPNGAKVDLIGSLTPLENGQVDLGSGYLPSVASQLDNVKNVTTFGISDVFYGYRILAPKGKYKTVSELMKSGKSYQAAVKQVLAQMKGKEVIERTGVVPTFYNLITKRAGTTTADWKVSYLANPDIVRAAQSGKADFVSPTGAVEITTLLQDGWESLIDLPTVIDNEKPADTVSLRSTFSGYLTTTEYADAHWDTLLRFTSVMYRLIADMDEDPKAVATDYVDYLNSYTGSKLTADQLAATFDGLYSLRNFDDATQLYDDESDPFNVATVAGAQIKDLEDQKVLKGDYSVDDLSIAGEIYADLVKYKKLADENLAKAPDGDLKTKAQGYYDAYDFLDAYRLAAQAVKG